MLHMLYVYIQCNARVGKSQWNPVQPPWLLASSYYFLKRIFFTERVLLRFLFWNFYLLRCVVHFGPMVLHILLAQITPKVTIYITRYAKTVSSKREARCLVIIAFIACIPTFTFIRTYSCVALRCFVFSFFSPLDLLYSLMHACFLS